MTVVLDAEYDARVAGLCTCRRCLDAYIGAYRREAERMGVRVVLASGPVPGDDPDDEKSVWQAIHDRTDWQSLSDAVHRRYRWHAGTEIGPQQTHWSAHTRWSREAAEREARRLAQKMGGRPIVEYWPRDRGPRPGPEGVAGAFYLR